MYRNNTKHKIIENQEKDEKSLSFADNFAKKPKFYLKLLTPSHLRVMDAFVYYDNKHGNIFPGQQEIANIAGISYNHCNKKIKELITWGFIEKETRGYRKSLQYYLNPMFKDKSIRARLSKYIPSLRWVPLITLMAVSLLLSNNKVQLEYNEPIRERNIFIYPYPTVIDSYTVKASQTYGLGLNKNLQKEKKNGFNMNAFEKKNILEQIANKKYENVVPSYIKELKNLNLTKWGQIRLSVFPEQAIKFANDCLKTTAVQCKFSFMIKLCMDYCRKNDIRPDWKWQNKLFEVLHKPDNASMFLQKNITKQNIETTYTSLDELEKDILIEKELQLKYMKIPASERGNLYIESLKRLRSLEKQYPFVRVNRGLL